MREGGALHNVDGKKTPLPVLSRAASLQQSWSASLSRVAVSGGPWSAASRAALKVQEQKDLAELWSSASAGRIRTNSPVVCACVCSSKNCQ